MTRFLLLCLLLPLTAAAAPNGPPTKFLNAQIEAVRALLAQKPAAGTPQAAEVDQKLMGIVDPVMEFDKLSEAALQKHWSGLQPEQRAEFVQLFRELVFRSYLKRVRSANEEYSVVFEDEEPRGRKAAVVTAIAKTKVEIELRFHLETTDGKKWTASDVVIDEVSLVENYREQFNKIIAKDGWAGLIAKMKKKVGELAGTPLPPPQPEAEKAPEAKKAP